MGRFQPKAHPDFWRRVEDRTWFYVISGIIIAILVYIMIKY